MLSSPIVENLLRYINLSSNELLELPNLEELKQEFSLFLSHLESGTLRVARKNENHEWTVNSAIKQVILLGFRLGHLVSTNQHSFSFVDKDTFPVQQFAPSQKIRIVPGGTSIRRGAHIAASVIVMPPSYVNVGAFVDFGTLIDSNVLVGSSAQIGKNVHLSSGVQIGGVLEPIGAMPVIIEDEVFVGGNCGIYEGTHIGYQAVLGAGVILTASSHIYDLVNETIISASNKGVLSIPQKSVVIAGQDK